MSQNLKQVRGGGDLTQALIGLTVIVLAQASIYDSTALLIASIFLFLVIVAMRLMPVKEQRSGSGTASAARSRSRKDAASIDQVAGMGPAL